MGVDDSVGDVSPLALVVPPDSDAPVAVAPVLNSPARDIRSWVSGRKAIDRPGRTPADERFYREQVGDERHELISFLPSVAQIYELTGTIEDLNTGRDTPKRRELLRQNAELLTASANLALGTIVAQGGTGHGQH